MNERDAKIADKLNNSRQMCREIQALCVEADSQFPDESQPAYLTQIGAAAVRAEELCAEAVQLLRSEK